MTQQITKDQVAHLKTLETKSAMIRYLYSEGFSYYGIGKLLSIAPQHARNVVLRKVSGNGGARRGSSYTPIDFSKE